MTPLDNARALALELERRGKPKTSVDTRAARVIRDLASAVEQIAEVQPDNWRDGDDPEQAEAWRRVVELAEPERDDA